MTRTSPDVDARNLLFFRGKSDGKWMTAPLEGAEGSMELVVYRNQEEIEEWAERVQISEVESPTALAPDA